MSRPNNPGASTGGYPPPRQHGLEAEAPQQATWPQAQAAQQQPPQGWPAPQQQPVRQPPPVADPYASSGYHYPQAAHSDTYGVPPPAPPPQQHRAAQPVPQQHQQYQQQQYAPPRYPQQQPASQPPPQFQAARPAAPQQQQQQQHQQARTADFAPPPPGQHQPGGYPPMAADPRSAARAPQQQMPPAPPRAPAAELRGSLADQWPTAQPQRRAPPQPDPRGFDLSAYAAPAQPRPSLDQLQAQPYQAAPAPRAGWPQSPAQQQEFAPAGAPLSPASPQPGRAVVAETEYAQQDEEYEEEPPRRSRGLVIVGALVGAIALGGGLAYAYKVFMAPTGSGKTPVVRNDPSPVKTAPAVAGGKQFANQDMKVPGRITDASASATGPGSVARSAAAAATDDPGARRVSTVTIGRDGAQLPPPAPPPGLAVGTSPLPGMTTAPVLPQPQAQRPAPPPAASPTEPRTITLPKPETDARLSLAPPVAKSPPPPAPQPKVATPRAPAAAAADEEAAPPAKKAPVRAAAMTAPAAAGAAKTSGFVAVLSSQRSSMDALKVFADLQQKYPSLQGRAPSVMEANIPDKGVFHRLVVGPPGPRDQATQLCSELKAAGYTGCWVTAQ